MMLHPPVLKAWTIVLDRMMASWYFGMECTHLCPCPGQPAPAAEHLPAQLPTQQVSTVQVDPVDPARPAPNLSGSLDSRACTRRELSRDLLTGSTPGPDTQVFGPVTRALLSDVVSLASPWPRLPGWAGSTSPHFIQIYTDLCRASSSEPGTRSLELEFFIIGKSISSIAPGMRLHDKSI